MFSPPIINDYINQLEALKRKGKENSKESIDILSKYNSVDKQLNESLLDNVDLGNSWLLNCIGNYYEPKDDEETKDYIKAIEWWIKSANLGNSNAMNNLGVYYDEIEKDYPKAIEWYIKSANLGNSNAMCNLGIYYDEIENDYTKAIEWYIKSANLDNSWAMKELGAYYQNIKNYTKAIECYIKSSNLGNTTAMNNLKYINIEENDYDYIFELSQKHEGTEINLEIKNILLNKLPKEYIFNKQQEIIDNLKSVKHQGIDKVLCNQVFKHF